MKTMLFATLLLTSLTTFAQGDVLEVTAYVSANVLAHCPTEAKKLVEGYKWIGDVSGVSLKVNEDLSKYTYTFQSYQAMGWGARIPSDVLKVIQTIVQPPSGSADMPATVTYKCIYQPVLNRN